MSATCSWREIYTWYSANSGQMHGAYCSCQMMVIMVVTHDGQMVVIMVVTHDGDIMVLHDGDIMVLHGVTWWWKWYCDCIDSDDNY